MNGARQCPWASLPLVILISALFIPCGCDRGSEPSKPPTSKPADAGKPIVLEKPLFELTVNKRAYLRVDEPPGKPVEIVVLQKQTVLHVRFK